MDGILNVYKEQGYTSHDVVARLRGILHMKKIGHTGTLDPMAEGVLPVCVGSATKLCEFLTEKDKTYEAVCLLGKATDTQDVTGQVLREAEPEEMAALTAEKAEEALLGFTGPYLQVPPMYSALKVGGQKLVDLARRGTVVERQPRPVTIHGITVLETALPRIRFEVTCSRGTYVRTLCDDLGARLGTGACLEKLTRLASGTFRVEQSLRLSEIEELAAVGKVDEVLLPVDTPFSGFPACAVTGAGEKFLSNGNPLPAGVLTPVPEKAEGSRIRVLDAERTFRGLYEFRTDKGLFWPVKLFL